MARRNVVGARVPAQPKPPRVVIPLSPPVCIIIAARNARATIGRALTSALAQSEASEVIVIDDASTDGTAAAAQRADDGGGRMEVVRLTENVGPAAARNIALGRCKSPFVCVLDADDFMLPGRIGKLLAEMREGVDLVADDLLLARPGNEMGPYQSLYGPGLQPHFIDLQAFVTGNIENPRRLHRELGFLKPLMRRSFLDKQGLQFNSALRLGEDYMLYAMALAYGARLKLIRGCGYVAVVYTGSLSRNHEIADLRAVVAADDELAHSTGLSSTEIAAIRRHQASVSRRLDHREFLDARRKREWHRAVAILLRTPRTTRYILRQTLRARLVRHSSFAERMMQRKEGASRTIYPNEPDRLFVKRLLLAQDQM